MNQLPAYLTQNRRSMLSDTIAANIGAGSPPYVSIRGNRFTLIDAVGEQEAVTTVDTKTGLPFLDCCVIDAGDLESKIFYAKPFDPSAQSWAPPDCWSDNGIAPSRNCSAPQHADCSTCPKSVWGSATSRVSGKGIPACAKYQKVALLLPGDDIAFLLRVPPNSLGNLRDYVHKFKGQQFDIRDVVTRISFEQGQLGTLTFVAVTVIDELLCKQRETLLNAKATDTIVGRGDLPRETSLAANPAPVQAVGSSEIAQGSAAPLAAGAPSQEPTGRRRRRTASAEPAAQISTAPLAPFRPNAEPQNNAGMARPSAVTAEIDTMLTDLFGPQK